MSDLSADYQALASYHPTNKVRFITAASLFDGHDTTINIMQRISAGHGRGGEASGAQPQRGRDGGGVIVGPEIRELQAYGVARIFSPEDGQRMGLAGMIGEMVMRCDKDLSGFAPTGVEAIQGHGQEAWRALAQLITAFENDKASEAIAHAVRAQAATKKIPVLGITGTGGAGKSSLTDELIRRLRLDQDDRLRIAVISIDPSRRKSGGALLGDRIRMNAINPWNSQAPTLVASRTALPPEGAELARGGQRVFMRSLATRDFGSEISQALPDVIAACKAAGFDLVIVETSGIGQGDAAIVPHVDVPMYG